MGRPIYYPRWDYTDFAGELPPTLEAIPQSERSMHFPLKLYSVLDVADKDGLGGVMSWQPHGRCFVIHEPKRFDQILDKYFPTISKLSSFQRQLTMYGFRRITKGRDRNGYFHCKFLRNRDFLVTQIERESSRRCEKGRIQAKAADPDLWSLPFVSPLPKQWTYPLPGHRGPSKPATMERRISITCPSTCHQEIPSNEESAVLCHAGNAAATRRAPIQVSPNVGQWNLDGHDPMSSSFPSFSLMADDLSINSARLGCVPSHGISQQQKIPLQEGYSSMQSAMDPMVLRQFLPKQEESVLGVLPEDGDKRLVDETGEHTTGSARANFGSSPVRALTNSNEQEESSDQIPEWGRSFRDVGDDAQI